MTYAFKSLYSVTDIWKIWGLSFIVYTYSFYLYSAHILVIVKEAVGSLPLHFGKKNHELSTRWNVLSRDFSVLILQVVDFVMLRTSTYLLL